MGFYLQQQPQGSPLRPSPPPSTTLYYTHTRLLTPCTCVCSWAHTRTRDSNHMRYIHIRTTARFCCVNRKTNNTILLFRHGLLGHMCFRMPIVVVYGQSSIVNRRFNCAPPKVLDTFVRFTVIYEIMSFGRKMKT